MTLNQAYDSQTVLKLFSCTKLHEAFQKDDIDAFYLDRSISYADYFDEFGNGMLLLPQLVDLLEG